MGTTNDDAPADTGAPAQNHERLQTSTSDSRTERPDHGQEILDAIGALVERHGIASLARVDDANRLSPEVVAALITASAIDRQTAALERIAAALERAR